MEKLLLVLVGMMLYVVGLTFLLDSWSHMRVTKIDETARRQACAIRSATVDTSLHLHRRVRSSNCREIAQGLGIPSSID